MYDGAKLYQGTSQLWAALFQTLMYNAAGGGGSGLLLQERKDIFDLTPAHWLLLVRSITNQVGDIG